MATAPVDPVGDSWLWRPEHVQMSHPSEGQWYALTSYCPLALRDVCPVNDNRVHFSQMLAESAEV